MNYSKSINILRNIRDGFSFIAYLMLFFTACMGGILALQDLKLNTNIFPAWAVILLVIFSLISVLLTYKDISEVASNSERKEVGKLYHLTFSVLTAIGYFGTLYITKEPIIGVIIVAVTFAGKFVIKRSKLKKHT